MRTRRSWWTAFVLCTALVLATLVWVSWTVVGLERAELDARAKADHGEALRLALWRMDSWLAPLLAREAARPYFDYQPFYPQHRAYTTLLSPIEPGEVLAPSPLLAFDNEYLTLHYQIEPSGEITSPQAPRGEYEDLAQSWYSADELSTNAEQLEEISSVLVPAKVEACVSAFEVQDAARPASIDAGEAPDENVQLATKGLTRDQEEYNWRKGMLQQSLENQIQESRAQTAQIDTVAPGSAVEVGSLVPFWATTADRSRLVFARRIRVNGESYFQGFVCDWPRLRDALLAQVGDLFPTASLEAVRGMPDAGDPEGNMLATIPVALQVPAPAVAATGLLTPVRWTLVLAWFAVLAGIAAVAVTLQASIAFGQKRSRFASAVTHELRTPLTTFQMYSEMLADGMIDDEARRGEYLQTLKSESARLANLVENVLAYARLEEGRRRPVPRTTTVRSLLDGVVPDLRRRAEAAKMTLDVESDVPEGATVRADVDAIGQVLGNLVDNACKYAGAAEDRTISLRAVAENGHVAIRVRDRGPGIPPRYAGAIFSAFDRGGRDATDRVPGLGLGLALARGLARDLGGDLELDRSPEGGGASFTLRLSS